jgi:hypothetical protein
MNPTIRLWEHVGMCLIIEYPSGVWYSNQTGGHNCLQPSLEGVLVPVRNEGSEDGRLVFSPESDLSDYFKGPKWCGSGATSGIDADDADYIEKALSEAGLSESISVDRSRLNTGSGYGGRFERSFFWIRSLSSAGRSYLGELRLIIRSG